MRCAAPALWILFHVALWAGSMMPAGANGNSFSFSSLGGLTEHVDCRVSAWGAPGACSAKCGGGLRTYRRVVLTAASGDGKPCPPLLKASHCNWHVCSEGPEEKAKKTAEREKQIQKEQSESREKYFASREKKVLAAQDKSSKALMAALEDPRTGLKASNDDTYVHLVNSVSNELKEYDEDKQKRDGFIEKQVGAKRELFEKRIVDAVHGMKMHMSKAHTFKHNPLYRNKQLEGQYQLEAAKETTAKQKLILRAKKEKATKTKLASLHPQELGESGDIVAHDLSARQHTEVPKTRDFASVHCQACFKSCHTVQCEKWCHQTFCQVAGHPEEYLESWPGITLGSSSKRDPEGEERDPDRVTSQQHSADEKQTKKEVFDRNHAKDPDMPDGEQHEKNLLKTEQEVNERNQKKAEEKQEQERDKQEKGVKHVQKEEKQKEDEAAQKNLQHQEVKDVLNDKIIELKVREDDKKELAEKKDKKDEDIAQRTSQKQMDLERLRQDEKAAQLRVQNENADMKKLRQLTETKMRLAADMNVEQKQVQRLMAKKALLEAQKEKMSAQAEYTVVEADDDRLHAELSNEKSAKFKEKEATIKEKEHKGSQITKLEKKNKHARKHYVQSLKKTKMEEVLAKHTATEARHKLQVASKVEQLTSQAEKLEQSTKKIQEEAKEQKAGSAAASAIQRLENSRMAAYKAQRKAAKVAKEIGEKGKAERGGVIKQGHADMDATKMRSEYEKLKIQTKELVKNMPTATGHEAEMAEAENEDAAAKEKSKKAAKKFLKEKEMCEKMEKEADIACSGPSNLGESAAVTAASDKGAEEAESKKTDEADGKKTEESSKKEKNSKGGKKTDEADGNKTEESDKKEGDSKAGGPKPSKVCNNAQNKAKEVCKNVRKAENEAEADAMSQLQRAAYVAQMKAAQVAVKEAVGDAKMSDVKKADAEAADALRKANEPVKLKGNKTPKMFTASQVQVMVAAEVKKMLDAKKLSNNVAANNTASNATSEEEKEGKEELDQEVVKDVDKDINAETSKLGKAKAAAKEKGEKQNKKDKQERANKKKEKSKEGGVKQKAKKVVEVRVKKGARLLKRAYRRQLRTAKLDLFVHQGKAKESAVVDADEAAAEAKEASNAQMLLTGDAIQCYEGHGKILAKEKELAGMDPGNKALIESVEQEIVTLTNEVARACKKDKKDTKAEKGKEAQAEKDNKRVKKEMKAAESSAEKNDAAGKGSGSGSGSGAPEKKMNNDYRIIVENGAITATRDTPEEVAPPKAGEPQEPRDAANFNVAVDNKTNTITANYKDPYAEVKKAMAKAKEQLANPGVIVTAAVKGAKAANATEAAINKTRVDDGPSGSSPDQATNPDDSGKGEVDPLNPTGDAVVQPAEEKTLLDQQNKTDSESEPDTDAEETKVSLKVKPRVPAGASSILRQHASEDALSSPSLKPDDVR